MTDQWEKWADQDAARTKQALPNIIKLLGEPAIATLTVGRAGRVKAGEPCWAMTSFYSQTRRMPCRAMQPCRPLATASVSVCALTATMVGTFRRDGTIHERYIARRGQRQRRPTGADTGTHHHGALPRAACDLAA